MKCAKVQRWLLLFVDGELPERRARRVAAHIQHCPACARQAELMRRVWQAAAPPAEVAPTAAIWYRVKARTVDAVTQQRGWAEARPRWAPALATAGVVILGIATGLLLSRLIFVPADRGWRLLTGTQADQLEVLRHRLVLEQLQPGSLPRVYLELAELPPTGGQP